MKQILKSTFILFVAAGMLAGCASTKKAAPHPLAGMWDYSVDTPDGTYKGVVSIMEVEGSLVGSITSDALPGKMDLTGLTFVDNHVSFKFDSGQFGILTFEADVMDDMLNGSINVEEFGEMPVTGQKKKMDDM